MEQILMTITIKRWELIYEKGDFLTANIHVSETENKCIKISKLWIYLYRTVTSIGKNLQKME